MKVSYKAVKKRQKENKDVYPNIYRKISAPFTYAFVRLNISPISISILNFFVPLIGYFFLSAGSYGFMIIGFLFFILSKILDCCDGEVARVLNPKAMEEKSKNIEGPYFDGIAHYIYSICLGIGLGVGMFRLYKSEIYLLFGLILSIGFILETALIDLLKSSYRKAVIGLRLKDISDNQILGRIMKEMTKGVSWSHGNVISKLIGMYPFQGLIYTSEFMIIVSIAFAAAESSAVNYVKFSVLYGITASIMTVYILILIVTKLFYVAGFAYKVKKYAPITKVIKTLS